MFILLYLFSGMLHGHFFVILLCQTLDYFQLKQDSIVTMMWFYLFVFCYCVFYKGNFTYLFTFLFTVSLKNSSHCIYKQKKVKTQMYVCMYVHTMLTHYSPHNHIMLYTSLVSKDVFEKIPLLSITNQVTLNYTPYKKH